MILYESLDCQKSMIHMSGALKNLKKSDFENDLN